MIRNEDKTKQETEEKYKFITDRMTDIVWTLNLDLKTEFVTPSILKVLGFSQEERLNQTLDEIMTPESMKMALDTFNFEIGRDRDIGVNPDRSITLELEFYNKEGKVVWFDNLLGLFVIRRVISPAFREHPEILMTANGLNSLCEKAKRSIVWLSRMPRKPSSSPRM